MRRVALGTTMATVVLALAACGASPPVRYHTLMGPVSEVEAASASGAALLVEVLPVIVPERVNREEIVLVGADGTLDLRQGERWAAPLADEVRQIIGDALWRRLRAADIYAAPLPSGSAASPYRLAVRIERLDAVPGRMAAVAGSWTLRRLPQGKPAVCRAAFTERPADATTQAAVASLTAGTARLAEAIADSLERLDKGDAAPCAGG